MSEHIRIDGGVAVIAGAANGIGAGLARYAATRDMRLVLADWDGEALEQFAEGLPGDVVAVRTDVRDEAQLAALAETAFDRFGAIDLLFNNAGVLASGQSWDIDAETWQRSLDINIGGVVNGIRAFVPKLIAADRPARIVNTSSVGGFLAAPLMAPYSATKFAVVAITEALAGELAAIDSKVQVSLLAPGPVKTGLMANNAPEAAAAFMAALRAMAERNGMTPNEFAPLVFAGIERGDYWIVPQPEALDDRLRDRMTMILERRHPVAPRISEGDDK
ncbi:MAG: SDR family NAD(P)-dependent oxidoreductase [Pseudomonadota bacterium]